jgi:CRP-like cAMP-binding protein
VAEIKRRNFFDEDFRFILNFWPNFRIDYRDLIFLLGTGIPHKYYKKGVFYHKLLSTVAENACFGETALVDNSKRSCTIVCSKDCEMLTLKKQDYQKIFEGILVTEESKLNFFETFFGGRVGKTQLTEMQYKFTERDFSRGAKIFGEREKVDYVYILKSGEVQLSMDVHFKNFGADGPGLNHSKAVRSKCDKESFALETVAGISWLGEDDVLLGRELRSYSAKALSSPTVVYAILKAVFDQSISALKVGCPRMLKQALEKCNFRAERVDQNYQKGEIFPHELLNIDPRFARILQKPDRSKKRGELSISYRNPVFDLMGLTGQENISARDLNRTAGKFGAARLIEKNRLFMAPCPNHKNNSQTGRPPTGKANPKLKGLLTLKDPQPDAACQPQK